MSHDYRILICIIEGKLREGRVIEAFEKLQELKELNQKNLEKERK